MPVIRQRESVLLPLMLLLFAASAGAAVDEVETIVVTASRINQSPADLVQAVEVIDRAEIEARQVANVTELLRQITGANVVQQGGRGGVTSIIMRGGEPNFTVVMIDGVKVNDLTNTSGGSYDFSYLDIANIERVEIVRGPMSALYGSDALSGVVNLVTRNSTDGASVRVEAGGYGLKSAGLSFGGSSGPVEFAVGAHALSEDESIEGGTYEDAGAYASLGADLGAERRIGASVRFMDAESTAFPEDSGGPDYAVIRDVDQRDVRESLGRIFYESPLGSRSSLALSASRYRRDEDASSPGIAPGIFDGVPPNSADTEFTRDRLLASARTAVSDDLALLFGAEWQNEDGRSTGVIDIGFPLPTDFQLDRDTLSAFAEFDWRMERLSVQGSVRWDDPDAVDAELSSQLGLLIPVASSGEIRINWGQGFKAPSFFALGHPLVGNPDLKEETADSIDVGYRHTVGDNIAFQVSIYRADYENLIDFDPDLFTNVNRSSVVAEGVEISGEFSIGDSVEVRAHATYSDSDIKDSDARLRGRPRWRGGFVGVYTINEQWQASASFLVMDESWQVSIPTGGMFIDGYSRLDLAATYDVNEHLSFAFAIDNALDSEYYEAVGFPAPGARGRVRARYRF